MFGGLHAARRHPCRMSSLGLVLFYSPWTLGAKRGRSRKQTDVTFPKNYVPQCTELVMVLGGEFVVEMQWVIRKVKGGGRGRVRREGGREAGKEERVESTCDNLTDSKMGAGAATDLPSVGSAAWRGVASQLWRFHGLRTATALYDRRRTGFHLHNKDAAPRGR